MMSSIDGRLLADRWTEPAAGIAADTLRRHYEDTAARLAAEGWIVGCKAMESFAKGAARAPGEIGGHLRGAHIADRRGRDVAVAVDRRGKLHYGQDHAGGDHIVAVLGEQVSDRYLAELFADGVS